MSKALLGGCVAAVMMVACSSVPRSADAPAEDLVGRLPESAWVQGDALYIRYAHHGHEAVLVAAWPSDATPGVTTPYRVARLDVLPPGEPVTTEETERRSARLLPLQAWDDMLRAVLAALAPADPDEAALAAVQGADIVFARDASGALAVHALERKPATLRVVRRIEDDELARAMQREVEARYGRAGPLVFQVSAGDEGRAFVLFDASRGISVLIMPASLVAGRSVHSSMGMALTLTDALVIRSHLLAPLTRPVSSLGRLSWLTLQTAVDAVPRGHARPVTVEPPMPGAPMDLEEFERELDRIAGANRALGTAEPLIDGAVFFPRLVQAVQDARESIRLRLYIFDVDEVAVRFADLLKRRSADLKVQVLLDQFGTIAAARVPPAFSYGSSRSVTPASITRYLTSDSEVKVRTAANPWLTSDHTKTIVVDGRTAYLGGMNIGYEYRYDWHDMMIELRGPIVTRLARDFDLAWAHAALGGDLARLAALAQPKPADLEAPAGAIVLRPLYTRTADPQIMRAQLAAIHRARRYIWLEQAYMSDDVMIAALVEARQRGVDVRVVLPSAGDSGFMNAANLVAANVFVRNGIRVYAYRGMTHVKAAIYDGWACLGSANFDKLSLQVNLETNIGTSDPAFVDRLKRELFERDFARSQEMTEPRPLGWSTYLSSFIARQL